MKIIKTILKTLFVLFVLGCIFNYDTLLYGYRQAKGQLSLLLNTVAVEDILKNDSTSVSTQKKLLLIQEIKQFTVDSLGLNPSESYTTYYDQKGKPLIWMMTASERFRLKPYQWKFPVLGTFTYKGHFRKELAINELKTLEKKGYDTRLSEVAAWSTLGYLNDPILSSMLNRNEGQLAALIIHELTHGTLYIKSNVEFNENLADFIGDYGAIRFLEYKYGKHAPQLKQYEREKLQEDVYSAHILRGTKALEKLYDNFEQLKLSENEQSKQKMALIAEIMQTLDTNAVLKEKQYGKKWQNKMPNNAYFISFLNYRKNQNQFKEAFETKFNSNFKQYLAYLKQNYASL